MQKGRKCCAHARLKKTREARLQSQETQSQSQAAGRPHSGLGTAQHAGYMPLRLTSGLWKMTSNGLPRKCCWQRWVLPRGQSRFNPTCQRPSRSQRNACFQRKLPDSQRQTPRLAGWHPLLLVRERGGRLLTAEPHGLPSMPG